MRARARSRATTRGVTDGARRRFGLIGHTDDSSIGAHRRATAVGLARDGRRHTSTRRRTRAGAHAVRFDRLASASVRVRGISRASWITFEGVRAQA